jgi:predicted RNA-binding Zn-ribbon protein involved in translation (DUF1610 family)
MEDTEGPHAHAAWLPSIQRRRRPESPGTEAESATRIPACRTCMELNPKRDHIRYYCPKCGTVQCVMTDRQGRPYVPSHFIAVADETDRIGSIPFHMKRCGGGWVVPEQDKAP